MTISAGLRLHTYHNPLPIFMLTCALLITRIDSKVQLQLPGVLHYGRGSIDGGGAAACSALAIGRVHWDATGSAVR